MGHSLQRDGQFQKLLFHIELVVKNMAFFPVLLLTLLSVYPAHTFTDIYDDALEWTDGGKFYCSAIKANHDTAESKCSADGMSLAVVEERPLLIALTKHCRFCTNCHLDNMPNCDASWVGGKWVLNSNFYAWSNGAVIDKDDPIWRKGEPKSSGECLEINIENSEIGLNDRPCSKWRRFVCEQKP